jgi:hypothetical protein
MLVYELHESLSRVLGDTIFYDSTQLDRKSMLGENQSARFSVQIRDSYLTRAMRTIQMNIKSAIKDEKQYSDILFRMFPEQMREERLDSLFPTFPYIPVEQKIYHIYSLRMLIYRTDGIRSKVLFPLTPFYTGTNQGYVNVTRDNNVKSDNEHTIYLQDLHYQNYAEVPVVSPAKFAKTCNSRTIGEIGAIATITNYQNIQLQVIDGLEFNFTSLGAIYEYITNNPTFEVRINSNVMYIPVAMDLSELGVEDRIPFDDIYINEIIKLASFFAQVDNQFTPLYQQSQSKQDGNN